MFISHRLWIRRRNNEYLKQKIITYGLIGLIGCVIVGFIFVFLAFAWYAKDLPSPGKLSQQAGYSTIFYDKDGKTLYEMYKDKDRVPVQFKEISNYIKKATIAIEDKNFYTHKGISETGIIRGIINLFLKHRLEGGSTITQQLIKNVLLTSERTLPRKIKEAILAYEVEKKYSKDQILEMYLNEAPYGGSFYGVGSASMGYFGKSPKDLNLVESAILSGLPQNPTYYSPFIGKNNLWKGRAQDVLRRMREDGYISQKDEQDALKKLEKVTFSAPKISINAPHFIFYVKDQLEKQFGPTITDQGLKIKTTLAIDVQKTAEKIVNEEIGKLTDYHVGNGAVVVLDSQTGQILAMVGSYDFNNEKYGKFNAALGLRQPGSALKPFIYALALEKGYTASTVIMDVKTVFPSQGEKDYIPDNYDGKFKGPIQLRFTLGNSINIPAVKLIAMLGIRDFLQKAYDSGLDTLPPSTENLKRFGLSISLGGGEVTLLDLTSSFSIFVRGGVRKDYSSILEVKDYRNKEIYKAKTPQEKKVFTPEVSFILSHILSDNNARLDVFGPNSYLNVPGKTVAVKTGTTNDKRDNWAVGYTKSITVGVWVGNNDNSPMNPKIASGATGASPIWYRIMRELLKTYKDGIMDKPNSVRAETIDAFLGGKPKDGRPTRSEYFTDGTEPKDIASFYKKLKISKANGKLANEMEIHSGNYDEKDYIIISENDPVSTDGKNRWQEAIDAWAREQSDDVFHPPTETSDASSDSIIVSIKSPSDKEEVKSNSIEIKAKIASADVMKNIKIYLNGNEIRNIDGDVRDVNEPVSLTDGVYELKITAKNEKGKQGESSIKFGVNKAWDYTTPAPPAPSSTTTPGPTETPTLTLTP